MLALKGLTRALNDSGKFKYKVGFPSSIKDIQGVSQLNLCCFQHPESVVDFVVIGGGA